jgi:hypothetical protein
VSTHGFKLKKNFVISEISSSTDVFAAKVNIYIVKICKIVVKKVAFSKIQKRVYINTWNFTVE